MSIFDNAIDAIQTGVEDYQVGTAARLKAAARNVHAGVLLMFKHKLQLLSPEDSDEVLLKQRVLPKNKDGNIEFVGQGKKTVDLPAIKERLTALKIEVDWKAVDSLTRLRNDIEHYHTTANNRAIQEALANAFAVVSVFTQVHLSVDLKNHLSDAAWTQLIDIKDVYDAERQRCRKSVVNFSSDSAFAETHVDGFYCSECYSNLINFTDQVGAECRACGKTWDTEEIVLAVVGQAGAGDAYSAVKDGGLESVVDCPECGAYGYVVEESTCVSCGATGTSECQRCGVEIPPGEIDGSGVCSWCDHMMSKLDKD